MPATTRRLAALLALTLLLPWASGCGGGCGDAPGTGENKAPTTSGGGGGQGRGGGEVIFEGTKESGKAAPLSQKEPEKAAPQVTKGPVFEEIKKAKWAPKILEYQGAALVMTYTHTPKCAPCGDAKTVLEALASDLSGQVAIYRLNVEKPEHAALLPKGMTALPAPCFIYYEQGQALTQRQSLPFSRIRGKGGEPLESQEEYLKRLKDWFRRAVDRKTLTLPASS